MNLVLKITPLLLFLTSGLFFIHHNQDTISVTSLSKKWTLSEYKYLTFSQAPSKKERNDYLHLQSDMTFSAVTEGVKEWGKWRLDAKKKRIYLSQEGQAGELIMIIDDLSPKQLVLIIDDPSDEDTKHLKICYKS
ncbi:MAG: hypothetical protein AAGG75_28645 [Bacteroidota bacterium]